MTKVERNMARISAKMAISERRLDAMANAKAAPSSLRGDASELGLGGLMRAVATDALATATARLRALHEAGDDDPTPRNPFGKPASAGQVLDGEYTVAPPER